MKAWLARLFPERVQTVKPLVEANGNNAERLKLLAQVAENDVGMRVTYDVIAERLATEFFVAIDVGQSAENKLRACEGMRVSWALLQALEQEREAAKEWKKEQGQ